MPDGKGAMDEFMGNKTGELKMILGIYRAGGLGREFYEQ